MTRGRESARAPFVVLLEPAASAERGHVAASGSVAAGSVQEVAFLEALGGVDLGHVGDVLGDQALDFHLEAAVEELLDLLLPALAVLEPPGRPRSAWRARCRAR